MVDVNMSIIAGRLARDPEMKDANGNDLCEFVVATERRWKSGGENKQKTTYIPCVAWKGFSHVVGNMEKGQEVSVQGRIEKDVWEDKQTHEKRSKFYLVVEDITKGRRPRKKEENGEQA